MLSLRVLRNLDAKLSIHKVSSLNTKLMFASFSQHLEYKECDLLDATSLGFEFHRILNRFCKCMLIPSFFFNVLLVDFYIAPFEIEHFCQILLPFPHYSQIAFTAEITAFLLREEVEGWRGIDSL